MSRIRKNYENSFARRFLDFVKGDKPLPEEDHVAEWKSRVAEVKENERTENANYIEITEPEAYDAAHGSDMAGVRIFRKIYYILAVFMCLMIIGMLIMNVAYMPRFGATYTPMNNEVAERYLEDGSEETGVVNTVTGMILQYRAFDTFGETNVLFVAACSVMILLFHKTEPPMRADGKKRKKKSGKKAHAAETEVAPEVAAASENAPAAAETSLSCVWPQSTAVEDPGTAPDVILQAVARVVVPMIFLFGLYILLNGHLSPGGGFSGGAVIGAGLILYNAAYGFRATRKFFDEKVYDIIKVGSLCLYAMIIAYYLFTGANGISSVVPLGKLGNILSSGLILPINLLVGLEVACTMYAFYALFRRGTF